MNLSHLALILCLAGIMIGNVLHLWIVARLKGANISARYFGTILDASKAHRDYAKLARTFDWHLWPLYVLQVAGYGGLLGAVVVLVSDRSLLDEIRRWVEQLR